MDVDEVVDKEVTKVVEVVSKRRDGDWGWSQRGVDEEDRPNEEDMADEVQAEEDEGELVGRHFKDTELELLDSDGTTWLVINVVHICYIRKDRGTNKTTAWECSGRRRLGCEFKTTKPEGPAGLVLSQPSR